MSDDLRPDAAGCGEHLRGLVVGVRVEEDRRSDVERLEPVEQAEGSDAVAVVTPGGVHEVGCRGPRQDVLRVAVPEPVRLDADADDHSEVRTVRPRPARALGQRAVGPPARTARFRRLGAHQRRPTHRVKPTSVDAARLTMPW